MAIYTVLDLADAARLAEAHGLPAARAVQGVPAGSVNSNFLIDLADGRTVFARIYEEQDEDGVAFEGRVLDHLLTHGLPVPRRLRCAPHRAVWIEGKPTGLFEVVGGTEVCQSMVDAARAREAGRLLGRLHVVGAQFSERRAGRFTRTHLRARLAAVVLRARPELAEATRVIAETLEEVERIFDDGWPSGLIHGDLFRDNVRWDGDRVVAVLDWESAAYGTFVYDVAVTLLAWCCGDALDLSLMDAMLAGYREVRMPEPEEANGLRAALLLAAARFTTTRITDYHLREDAAQVKKDWRRFYGRLQTVHALSSSTLAAMMRPDA